MHVVWVVAAISFLVNIGLSFKLLPGSQHCASRPHGVLLAERYMLQRDCLDLPATKLLVVETVGPDDLHHVLAVSLDSHILGPLEVLALFKIRCTQLLVVALYAHA